MKNDETFIYYSQNRAHKAFLAAQKLAGFTDQRIGTPVSIETMTLEKSYRLFALNINPDMEEECFR